jgi:hypothetical protein
MLKTSFFFIYFFIENTGETEKEALRNFDFLRKEEENHGKILSVVFIIFLSLLRFSLFYS